jgi:hypothetical protein
MSGNCDWSGEWTESWVGDANLGINVPIQFGQMSSASDQLQLEENIGVPLWPSSNNLMTDIDIEVPRFEEFDEVFGMFNSQALDDVFPMTHNVSGNKEHSPTAKEWTSLVISHPEIDAQVDFSAAI